MSFSPTCCQNVQDEPGSDFATAAVTWQQWPVQFELRCANPGLLARAQVVLRHWNEADSGRPFHKVERYNVEWDGEFYEVARSGDFPPLRTPDAVLVIRLIESEAAMALVEQYQHIITAHGAMLEKDGHGVLILGPSYAGKSTLSCALWREGWSLLSDDLTIIDPQGLQARPVHRRISLRAPSRELLGDAFWQKIQSVPSCSPSEEGYVFHPAEVDGFPRKDSCPLSAVLFLGRLDAPALEPAAACKLIPVKALLAMAPYTNIIRYTDLGTAIKALQPVLDKVPAYDIARGPLLEMVRAVKQLTLVN